MSKRFRPTAEQRRNVEAMVGFGVREADICRLILNPETGRSINEKTLRQHFGQEIDTGQIKANARVAESMYEMATKCENPSARVHAASFWLSRRAGWKETSKVELTGEDGAPIKIDHARERIADRIAALHEKLRGREAGMAAGAGAGEDSGEPE
jgi:hypothetical protein